MGYVRAMEKITLNARVINRIHHTPFGHFLYISELIVNNYQGDDLCGGHIEKHTFHLKNKDLKITAQDVGKILSILYDGGYIKLSQLRNLRKCLNSLKHTYVEMTLPGSVKKLRVFWNKNRRSHAN